MGKRWKNGKEQKHDGKYMVKLHDMVWCGEAYNGAKTFSLLLDKNK